MLEENNNETEELLEEFKCWIEYHCYEKKIGYYSEDEGNKIYLESKNATGKIRVYDLNIIELSAENKISNEPIFYLHFQLNTIEHAKKLVNELIDAIRSVHEKGVHYILFTCSAGLTTGFFADKINNAFNVLNLDYHVDAVSFTDLEDEVDHYELVCLAPQIAYMEKDIRSKIPRANLIQIPAQVFAAYDVGTMVRLILNQTQSAEISVIKRPHSYRELQKHEKPILCLSIIRNSRRTHILYAVYDSENVVMHNEEVIKPKISLDDIYDAIDVCINNFPEICCIGLSLPGIISKDSFISANYVTGLNNHSLDELFTNKYHKPFIFTNDANAAAVGYYASHPKYESLSFIYQPLYYRAGIGSVVNGKLLAGAHNLSGEVKLLPIELSKPFTELIKTSDGAVELVTKQIIALMTTIDPEAIVVCSQLIPNISIVKDELLRYFGHPEYLPDLLTEANFHIYLFMGQLILCIQYVLNEK